MVVKGLAGLLGATTGVILIFVQNYIYSGQIIQASALMKAHWASYLQGTLFDPLYLALLTIGISDKIHSIALLVTILLLMLFLRLFMVNNETSSRLSPQERVAFTAANICLIGYFLLYTQSRPNQSWYTANLFVPVFMLLFVLAQSFKLKLTNKGKSFGKAGISAIAILIIEFNIFASYPIGSSQSPWPHQQIMRRAGLYLKQLWIAVC